MTKIFISYRRDDSQHAVDRLVEAIAPYVDDRKSDIFVDVDNIPLGIDFAEYLDSKVAECEILIAVIGRRWLNAGAEGVANRLHDPDDFIRMEIAAALRRGIPVVPILLDGAGLPRVDDLPDELKPLARRNGTTLDRSTFQADVDRMMQGLRMRPKQDAANAPPPRTSPAHIAETAGDRPGKSRNGARAGIMALILLLAGAGGIWALDPFEWRSDDIQTVEEPDTPAPADPVPSGPEGTSEASAPTDGDTGREAPVEPPPRIETAGPWDDITESQWSTASATAILRAVGGGTSNQPLLSAAEAGNANALTAIGLAYWGSTDNLGEERSYQALAKACEMSQMRACAQLGLMTERGWGTMADPARADELYDLACKASIQKGCTRFN